MKCVQALIDLNLDKWQETALLDWAAAAGFASDKYTREDQLSALAHGLTERFLQQEGIRLQAILYHAKQASAANAERPPITTTASAVATWFLQQSPGVREEFLQRIGGEPEKEGSGYTVDPIASPARRPER